jgi:hypothetical protein
MRNSKLKKSMLVVALGYLFGGTAFAVTGICPPTLGYPGPTGPGTATDCNLFITFNANGSIVTANGPQTNYDGSDDALIGVVNNSGHTLSSFNISGNYIFGFDGDGINTYTPVTNIAGDTTGYGGYDAWFSNILYPNSGTVNFLNGISTGGTDYFSVEEGINLTAPPIITSSVPEPGEWLMMFSGLGLIGFIATRRKNQGTNMTFA